MDNTIIFALSTNQELAHEICEFLNVDLGKIAVRHFADGEILVEPEETVRGKNVYLIQSTSNPVSESYMEVLIALDAFKRASANSVTVIMPYFGYARQDRKARARQPITAKLMADLLQTAGADRVVTIDLHASQIQGFFNIPIDDLTAVAMIGQYYRNKNFQDEVVIVSPDHGGATRARRLSDVIPNSTIAIIDKRRTTPNVAEAMNLVGDVDGKIAIVIDDMVDTAGSLMGGIDMLYERGAKEVYAACTHGVFSDPAVKRIADSKLMEVLTTNTIPLTQEALDEPKIKSISVAYMLSKAIEAVQYHTPVSVLFDLFSD